MSPLTSRDLIDGGLGGLVATGAISAVMLAAQRRGLIPEQPPGVIVGAALDVAHIERPPEVDSILALVAHAGFGAGCGALFAAIDDGVLASVVARRRRRATEGRAGHLA